MKNVAIVGLLLLVIWLSATVVRLENFRYATFVGFCSEPTESALRYECLKGKETRTSALWHLFYALTDDS